MSDFFMVNKEKSSFRSEHVDGNGDRREMMSGVA